MNQRNGRQIQIEFAADRELLLAVATDVDRRSLTWPTRNAGWVVRDVLAHVLASDADLISVLEEADRAGTAPLQGRSFEQHEQEMARWMNATRHMLAEQMHERSGRWQALLHELPDAAFSLPANVWWVPAARALADVLADWRGHDRQHAEDIRLALDSGRGDTDA